MFKILKKILLRNKTTFEHNEVNVVDSIVKARKLYKELIIKTHPDRNQQNSELANSLAQQVTENRYNYAELLKLQKIINEKLK